MDKMQYVIRPAAWQDVEAIAQLYVTNHRQTYAGLLSAEYFAQLTETYAIDKWKNYLDNADNCIFVVYEDAQFLGFAAGMQDVCLEDTWYLDSLHVTQHARGKGIGSALIHAMSRYAAEHGYGKMSVCIVKGNDDAGALYQKLGAVHALDFEDDFCGTVSQSEKLVWHDLRLMKK